MAKVYGYLTASIATSFGVAWAGNTVFNLGAIVGSNFNYFLIAILVQLVSLVAVYGIVTRSSNVALGLFRLLQFSAVMGITLAATTYKVSFQSIVAAVSGAGLLFGLMAFVGLTTKINLTRFYPMLMIALVAIILASIINIWIGLSTFDVLISVAAVIVFLFLTATDTQYTNERINSPNATHGDYVLGALGLYLDFLNLFLLILRLTEDD